MAAYVTKSKKRMHKRHASETRETEGRMERFGLNTINGEQGLGGASGPSSLLRSCNSRAHHC